jgi:hypothetical protein
VPAPPAITRSLFHARFIRAGRIRTSDNQPGPIETLPAALSRAVERGLFDGKAVFVDHAGYWDNPSLRDLVGVTKDSQWSSDSVVGLIEMYDTPDSQAVSELLSEIFAQGDAAPDIGLSIVFYPVWETGPADLHQVTDISHIESIDLVFGPADDGRLLDALSSHSLQPSASNLPPLQEPSMLDLETLRTQLSSYESFVTG